MNDKEIQIFNSSDSGPVRTTAIDGEPFFADKDVVENLGYNNPGKATLDHVDEEDKGVTKCDTLGGIQEPTVINEPSLPVIEKEDDHELA